MLTFKQDYPLQSITTLQIGGPARSFVTVSSQTEMEEAIQYAKTNHLAFLLIGGGSNLLVNDAGVDCLVIKNEMEGITKVGNILKIKSGTILQHLVDYSIGNNLAGLQALTDIPGTVGGAVYGNAGAYGQTISDHITQVTVLGNPSTSLGVNSPQSLDKEECEFGYRDSIFKKNKLPILEITFKLEKGDSETLAKEASAIIKKRLVKYPKGIKCPGSFFKNIVAATLPPEILEKIPKEKIVYGKLPAGSLLEEVGAKGDKLGNIEIADYHANLFINKGEGTAADFYNLARKYADKVKEKFGITLEPEVQLINLPPLFI